MSITLAILVGGSGKRLWSLSRQSSLSSSPSPRPRWLRQPSPARIAPSPTRAGQAGAENCRCSEVTLDGKIMTLHENESIYILMDCIHRLANPGSEPLEVIDVQTGDYLEEATVRTGPLLGEWAGRVVAFDRWIRDLLRQRAPAVFVTGHIDYSP
jgi:hypothetical protein